MTTVRPALVQTAWARVIVRALADAGVHAVVLSPGSRSTPLAAALADADLPVHPIIDERAAGFFALGLARATGRPVALVCTSGTAAAHYYPAVIEAALDEVPLVVVTADRPPELHDGGAPQTIDQARLYGVHVRTAIDLGPPDGSDLALRGLRRRVAHAVLASRAPRPGPVQLNAPLRKPLEPVAPETLDEHALWARAEALRGALPEPPAPALATDDAVAALAAALAAARRPMIVAGPLAPQAGLAAAVSRLALHHGAVVLAESTSQLRGALDPAVATLDAFDLVLASRRADALAPDLIVQLGGEPVAMAWSSWLAAHRDVPRWVLAAHAWPDPDASAHLLLGDVADALDRTGRPRPTAPASEWRTAVTATDTETREIMTTLIGGIDRSVGSTDRWDRPIGEHAALAAALDGAGDAVIAIGNSLPVRTIDHVWRGPGRVIAQRGASGIDGLIAGAAGAAAAGEPVVLVLGDVSFAHDVGALALLRDARAPVVVVVIDNGGGRIFEALPAAAMPAFDRLWLTPPALDVAAIARAFGLPAHTVRSPDELRAAVAAARAVGPAVIHAPVAPSSARELRAAAIARLDHARLDHARTPFAPPPAALHPGESP